MPVQFLSKTQYENYGQYNGIPSSQDLARYFHLDDTDHQLIAKKRSDHNRLGFAVQLCTLRYLGTFIPDLLQVPNTVITQLADQLALPATINLIAYSKGEQRWVHATEIRQHYGFTEITERRIAFSFSRWLYALCWTGSDRPSVLFERAKYWLLSHKVILPGFSTLERFIAKLRSRVEARVWQTLISDLTSEQQQQLLGLLDARPGDRKSEMERLRKGPVTVSSRSILQQIHRLKAIRHLNFPWHIANHVPTSRVMVLARYASTTKAATLRRMSMTRKVATLRALIYSLERSAQDDILDVLEQLLKKIFNASVKHYQQDRQSSIKSYDQSAAILAKVCQLILDDSLPDAELRAQLFKAVSQEKLTEAVDRVTTLIRPQNKIHFKELDKRYRTIRLFLPTLLTHVRFEGNANGKQLLAALEWLQNNLTQKKLIEPAPDSVIKNAWHASVYGKDQENFDIHAYVFCVMDSLLSALKRRDIFISSSWRYTDPHANLLSGSEWDAAKPVVCRALGLSDRPEPALNALATELDETYKAVAARWPDNPNVIIETEDDQPKLILTPIEKIEEPSSLVELRQRIAGLMPTVDLPEVILEVSTRTGFTQAFTHISEQSSRAKDIETSLCAVIMAEACNTGFEPLIRPEIPALKRDRLSWAAQNYLRNNTIADANAILVKSHTQIPLASHWGEGEIAAADGMRFVVPVNTVHAGPNPKYFGLGKGVTWYNLLSDQLSGLNDLLVPGTLRDSLSLLAVVLEQQTVLQPTTIMTDTGAYSDVVFGLFRLLGYRFSPRLADIGGKRFWRISPTADYGELNAIATSKVKLAKITPYWEDMLRLAGSLKLGKISALSVMKTLQVGNKPTRLALAIAEYGRIDKTIHLLTYLDDEDKRHAIQKQLNRVEGRHNLAREVFHGKRGELRKKYQEGQEDQLGSLGLMLNIIVYWNTIYIEAAIEQLKAEGYPVFDEDIARISPLMFHHINMLGRYLFAVDDAVREGKLRPLRNPDEEGVMS